MADGARCGVMREPGLKSSPVAHQQAHASVIRLPTLAAKYFLDQTEALEPLDVIVWNRIKPRPYRESLQAMQFIGSQFVHDALSLVGLTTLAQKNLDFQIVAPDATVEKAHA